MGLVAILTFIVITFAILVGSVIGVIFGDMYGDMYLQTYKDKSSDNKSHGWLGGVMSALIKATGGNDINDIAAIPNITNGKSKINNEIRDFVDNLFGISSDIDWATVDINNLSSDILDKLYKLYSQKHQKIIESNVDRGVCDDLSDKVKNILEAIAKAGIGVNVNNHNDTQISYISDPIVYADISTGNCNDTLMLAKGINAAKIYNINAANYCAMIPVINYIDGSLDKTFDIPDNSVNVVSMIDSMHHMPDRQHKIAEVKRILAPNGVVVIRDTLASTPDTIKIISLKHVLCYMNNLTYEEIILDYDEFKKMLLGYITDNQLYVFDRDELDKLMLGGDNILSLIDFKYTDNTFIATYKKSG